MSPGFAGYTCWKVEAANEALVVDAPMVSPGLFSATHFPMQMAKRPYEDWESTSGGEQVDEHQVLGDLLGGNPSGLLLLPIIGEAGTGKSHLVRWIWENLPEDPHRKRVYVPRHETNLRDIITRILEGLEGEAFEKVRQELASAANSLNPATAADELIDQLRNQVRTRGQQNSDNEKATAERLGILLQDVVYRQALHDKGKLKTFVHALLEGTRSGIRTQFTFVEGDLPRIPQQIAGAARPAQEAYRRIFGDPQQLTTAVRLLNDALEPAVNALFGLGGGGRLARVLVSARQALAAKGLELLIAVEDFVVLQGIQGELLDAVIAPAYREGTLDLCPVRMIMAVTTGYFRNLPNTVFDRGGWRSHIYSLDLEYGAGADQVPEHRVIPFLARYLNAARAGRRSIDAAHKKWLTNGGGPKDNWVPNNCDTCPHRATCHDAFGATDDGIGLYPFNASAISQMRALSGIRFDPRKLMRYARSTLTDHLDRIHHGDFPNDDFVRIFPARNDVIRLSTTLEDRIRRADPSDGNRRTILLSFWGDNPTALINLDPAIHEAFKLPSLTSPDEVSPELDTEGDTPLPIPPAPNQRLLDAIRAWASDEILAQQYASTVRSLIHSHVAEAVPWNDLMEHAPAELLNRRSGVWRLDSVRLPNAQGGGSELAYAFIVELQNDPATASLLSGLVQFDHHKSWDFTDGADAYRRYSTFLHTTISGLVGFLDNRAGRPDRTPQVVAVAAHSARILGIPGSASEDPLDLLNATLTPTPTVPYRDQSWERLVKVARGEGPDQTGRDELLTEIRLRFGAAQGTGAIRAIDAAGLLPILAKFSKSWELKLPTGPRAESDLLEYVHGLDALVEPAIERELKRLTAWHQAVRSSLAPEDDPHTVAAAIKEFVARALTSGVLKPADINHRVRIAIEGLETADYTVLKEVEDIVHLPPRTTIATWLAHLGPDRSAAMSALYTFVTVAQEAVNDTEVFVKQQIAARGGGTTAGFKATLLQHLQSIEASTNSLKGLR